MSPTFTDEKHPKTKNSRMFQIANLEFIYNNNDTQFTYIKLCAGTDLGITGNPKTNKSMRMDVCRLCAEATSYYRKDLSISR